MRLFGTRAKPPAADDTIDLVVATPMPRAASAAVGQVYLGRYELTDYIGEGSNARVYRANDLHEPGRTVCVKRIKSRAMQSPTSFTCFA